MRRLPISHHLCVCRLCHLYLLYCACTLGSGNQFHKDTGLISASVRIMRPALLLSSAELPARGQEQINRGVKQLPPPYSNPTSSQAERLGRRCWATAGRVGGCTENKTHSQREAMTPVRCLLLQPTFRISSSVFLTAS